MFVITAHKGFGLDFQNGISISVQFGKGDYCERRHTDAAPNQQNFWHSKNAEILIYDTVYSLPALGWQSPEQFAQIVHVVANAKQLSDVVF